MKLAKYLLSPIVLLIPNIVLAQKAREISLENDPVDWSDTAKLIVLIGIPCLMIIFGAIAYKKYFNRKKNEKI